MPLLSTFVLNIFFQEIDFILTIFEFNFMKKKFAWFVGRNGSWTYDGHFEMYTGAKDINRMGEMTKWNHVKKTRYFRDECSNVKKT